MVLEGDISGSGGGSVVVVVVAGNGWRTLCDGGSRDEYGNLLQTITLIYILTFNQINELAQISFLGIATTYIIL